MNDPFVEVEVLHQSALMQLMAREKLSVRVENTKTAYFDPKNRVVIIPMFLFFLSKDIADLFSSHEIAHALYSPSSFSDQIKLASKKFKSKEKAQFFVNCVSVFEDERIERLIKEEFKGLRSIFFRAYKTLNEEKDFFKVRDLFPDELANHDFLNKANLFYKAGDSIDIIFTDKEWDLIENGQKTKTFEDVIQYSLLVTEKLFKEEEKTIPKKQKKVPSDDVDDVDDVDETNETNETEEYRISSEDEDANTIPDEESPLLDEELNDLFKTDYEQLVDESVNNFNSIDLPDPKLSKNLIISSSLLTKRRSRANYKKVKTNKKVISSIKTNAKVMANEFQSKKSASQFAKMKIAFTGDLNTNRLSLYRTNDDLFKSREIIKDAQSHGIVLFVDYSSSMGNIISSVRAQMLQIAEFCNLSDIPFEIFAFSDHPEAIRTVNQQIHKPTHIHFRTHALLNLLSSSMTRKEYKDAFESIIKNISQGRSYESYSSSIEALNQTPLAAAKFDSIGIVQDFKNKHPQIQKVHCIFITDGASSDRIIPHSNINSYMISVGSKTLSYQASENHIKYQYGYISTISDHFLYQLFKKFHPDVEFSNLFLSSSQLGAISRYFWTDLEEAKRKKYTNEYNKYGMFRVDENDIFDNEFVINANIMGSSKGMTSAFDSSKSIYSDEDDLFDDFETSLIYKKQRNNISRKIAEFLS